MAAFDLDVRIEEKAGPMDSSTFSELLAEYGELETSLADPAVHADQGRARKLGRR